MSFYRKYRPQLIEEIDNVAVRERLLSFLTKEKKELPHAYLFTGPRGAGKTTSARLIAKLFNCEKPTKTGPCGTCEQCTTIAEGRNMDVLEIDAASNRGIDEIRQLREAIGLTPAAASTKVYIIDEVHMLTTEAFNALLKTLEEPPAHAVFVLATTDPQKVPTTVKSRCTLVNFGRATVTELSEALSRIAKAEKMDVNDDALSLIANFADGSFRDGVKLLEQISFHTGKITEETVTTLLAAGDEGLRKAFLSHLAKQETKEALAVIGSLVKDGKDIRQFLVDCLGELERLLIAHGQGQLLDTWNPSHLRAAIRKLSQAYVDLRTSPIPQLPLELVIVELGEETPNVVAEFIPRQKDTTQKERELKLAITEPTNFVQKQDVVANFSSRPSPGLLTLEKLTECWKDFIEELKPHNHSIAGVMRSTRPKSVADGIVTIEAFYSFHKDKLSEPKTKEILTSVLKKLFGEKVKVDIVVGKK